MPERCPRRSGLASACSKRAPRPSPMASCWPSCSAPAYAASRPPSLLAACSAEWGSLTALLGQRSGRARAREGPRPRAGCAARWPRSSSAAAISARPLEPRCALAAPADAARFLKAKLLDLPHEVFCCLFLDTRHRLIRYEELFRGTIDGATVYPREVVKRALAHNASAVILGHNHPSGVSEPSEADRSITLKLAKALALVEIRLLDHVVVSRGGHVSLAERGLV